VAVYRVKNAEATLEESLDATARFADAIVVLDDGSTDRTREICERHPAVARYEYQDLPFDERRDRNKVLALAEELRPDWIIVIDADEVFEMDRNRANRLMHLVDPHAKVLGFHWYTFWEPTNTYFRADGIFGSMNGYRMYRWEPGLRIVLGDEKGLHCGNIPQFPDGNARFTNIRVRHLGYNREELRQAKYAFYRQMDPTPKRELVGNTDYSHLISSDVSLRKYSPDQRVSLCLITRNEEERIAAFLAFYEPFVDEICVVDNGSTDSTVGIVRLFTDKIEFFPRDSLDLDQARNQCLSMASCPWILSLDPDEEISVADFPRLQRLMDDTDADAYTFHVANHQKSHPPVMTLAVRLFKNDERIRYSRPVHETVEESLKAHPELVLKSSELEINHWGFLKDDEDVEKKLLRYYERNKEYRDAHPQDALSWYNEALHYMNEGREDQAVRFFEEASRLDPNLLSARSQLAIIYQERAMRLWRSLGAATSPEHPVHAVARRSFEALQQVTPARPLVGNARSRHVPSEEPKPNQ
jgi:glycosyltransferase involved in cell wall biosynthesis